MATNRSHVAGLLLASELPFTTAEFGAVVAWLEVVVKMRLKRERDAKRDAEEKTIN